MSVGPRPFPQGRRNEDGSDPRATMTYEDYVYFMLSEEDRGNEHSLRYWFACVDLDGDGRIGHMEMRLFYESQVGFTFPFFSAAALVYVVPGLYMGLRFRSAGARLVRRCTTYYGGEIFGTRQIIADSSWNRTR